MFKIILIFIYLYYAKIIAKIRNCKNCENFIPFKRNQMHNFGFCKLFPLSVKEGDNSNFVYEFSADSRNNESLCGEVGFYYSEKLNENNTNGESTIKRLIDDYSLFLGRPSKVAEVAQVTEVTEVEEIDENNDKKNNVKKMIHEYNIDIRQNQVM